MTNAVKYTPDAGQIEITLESENDCIVSSIKDNGLGIPGSQQNRIFSKFFRADNARKTETDGTGLGLYFVQKIIAYSGGKIWFESIEGNGTTFMFSLPLTGSRLQDGEVSLDL
jgi:two-component system sensor histidine kinase VicK